MGSYLLIRLVPHAGVQNPTYLWRVKNIWLFPEVPEYISTSQGSSWLLFIWRLVLVKSLEQSSVTAQTGDTDSWGDKPLANKINRDTGRGAGSGSVLGCLHYDHSDKRNKVPKRGSLNPRDGEREPSVWEVVLRLQRKVYIHGNDRAAHANQVSLLVVGNVSVKVRNTGCIISSSINTLSQQTFPE